MKIQEDERGMFVIAGGWIGRPMPNSAFKPGDRVRASHPPGSGIFVRAKDAPPRSKPEVWYTDGLAEPGRSMAKKIRITLEMDPTPEFPADPGLHSTLVINAMWLVSGIQRAVRDSQLLLETSGLDEARKAPMREALRQQNASAEQLLDSMRVEVVGKD